ncbi:hypothetical protein [Sphingomonas sp.]|uniref:hypothetical protein n=1 Tax=Sphingomonas sp. TaxID=28214 RepID=UPI002D7E8087|nr:hypothetical protein [Sphingomonas sp.]HEU0045418.1 hypothetical protein [Sphingomonas sp.]
MTDAADVERRALLRTETRVAMAINAILSVVLFLLIAGWRDTPVSAVALGFLPQTFCMVFMGTLVPSLIMYRRVARGLVMPATPPPALRRHALRILALAVAAMVLLGGGMALLLLALARAIVPPLAGLIVNAGYGAMVGALVTPPVLRAVLGMTPIPIRADAALVEAR